MLVNVARGVCNFPVWRCPTLQAEFGENPHGIYPYGLRRWYFLCPSLQNASSQTIDNSGERDLSPYFASGVGKCHSTKNRPSVRVAKGNIFTKWGRCGWSGGQMGGCCSVFGLFVPFAGRLPPRNSNYLSIILHERTFYLDKMTYLTKKLYLCGENGVLCT